MKQKTRLSRPALRDAARIDARTRLTAQEWWYDNAPPRMATAYDPLYLASGGPIPVTIDELEAVLEELYPGPNGAEQRRRYRNLFLAGLLFFFTGGVLYNQRRQRIPPLSIRGAIDFAISGSRSAMLADCAALREGRISLAEWEGRMASWVRASVVAGAVMGAGGVHGMTDAHWAIVERNIEAQMGYLHAFAGRIASGEQPLDGNVCRIMLMYLQSGRGTYHDVEASIFNDRGFSEYASVTTANESCNGCIQEEKRGFVPMGELVPIGSRDCLSYCLCYYVYRNPTTGEVNDRR